MGRDRGHPPSAGGGEISIHSPRMGRDSLTDGQQTQARDFNPLSPHGERRGRCDMGRPVRGFQSTLPAWGETDHGQGRGHADGHFNPLSPHGERLHKITSTDRGQMISIHSPRMGRDGAGAIPPLRKEYFNPLSPHGERPQGHHRHPAGGYFNPLSPHGERRGREDHFLSRVIFQSTLPAWGETL